MTFLKYLYVEYLDECGSLDKVIKHVVFACCMSHYFSGGNDENTIK